MRRVWVVGLIVVFSGVAAVGCTTDAPPRESDSPGVIVPGRPGEDAKTLAPGEAPQAATKDKPNETDFRYVRMMIKHHQQALEMTGLVPQRGANPTVKSFASRIADTQGPDIKAMEAWQARNGNGPAHDSHEQMQGMASPDQLAALRAASGPDFDKVFLQLMIAHHEGAVAMATDVLQTGSDVFVEEMAQDVIVTQQKEIGQMQAMRTP